MNQSAPIKSTEPAAGDAPGETRPASRKRPVPPAVPQVLPRLLVLGLLLGIAQSWTQRHLAWSLLEEVEGAPIMAVLLPFLVTLLDFFGGKTEAKRLQTWLRTRAVLILRTPVLGFLALLVLAGGSMCSSVTVVVTEPHGTLAAELRPGAGGGRAAVRATSRTLDAGEESVRFFRMTHPFGRPFVLTLDGYQPWAFDLYPWLGKRVLVNEDLRFAQSVLVRVPLGEHQLLAGGRIELWSLTDPPRKMAESPTAELRGAAFFGRALALEGRLLTDWEHELRLAGAEREALSRGYVTWRHPAVVSLTNHLVTGQELEARFVAQSGKTRASFRFRVTTEPLQDILLQAERK